MARGWESKSIESQQADRDVLSSALHEISVEERAAQAHRRTLMLARARMAADLEAAREPAYRNMLEAALQTLDGQLGGRT